MENAYIVLGVHPSATLDDIEEAYRSRKQLCDLRLFAEGSGEWEEARAQNDRLDDAYNYAVAAVFAPRRSNALPDRRSYAPSTYYPLTEDASDFSPLNQLFAILLVCPLMAYFFLMAYPPILSDLASESGKQALTMLNVLLVIISYLFPLLLRFMLFRRPLPAVTALLCFPLTLLLLDLMASELVKFFEVLSKRAFSYIPSFYLLGVGPVFMVLLAHCSILTFSWRAEPRRTLPFLRRMSCATMMLALSLSVSMFICVFCNRDKPAPLSDPASFNMKNWEQSMLNDQWQTIELLDAGAIELPSSWYVEDSNGKVHRIESGRSFQFAREVLTARPYAMLRNGLNFAFEVLAYWWGGHDGREVAPPPGALASIQEQQFASLKNTYADLGPYEKTVVEVNDHAVSSLAAVSPAVQGINVKFKNIAFQSGNKLYFIMVSYPSDEEKIWDAAIDRILWRWRL